MTVLDPPTPVRAIVVESFDRMIVDTVRAGVLREKYLDPFLDAEGLADSRPFLVDLNGIRSLNVISAFELVGKWVLSLRAREPRVVVVTAENADILRTVHAALRDTRSAAYALLPGSVGEPLTPIGKLTREDLVDLDYVRLHGPTAGDAAVSPMRLTELYKQGLLMRDQSGRYAYPDRNEFD